LDQQKHTASPALKERLLNSAENAARAARIDALEAELREAAPAGGQS
jgi:hypothetical protein